MNSYEINMENLLNWSNLKNNNDYGSYKYIYTNEDLTLTPYMEDRYKSELNYYFGDSKIKFIDYPRVFNNIDECMETFTSGSEVVEVKILNDRNIVIDLYSLFGDNEDSEDYGHERYYMTEVNKNILEKIKAGVPVLN